MRFSFPHALILTFIALSCVFSVGNAEEARPLYDDPALEARLSGISGELRCLVCQNETLLASNAELAKDLRREIRAMLHQGQSDQEIIDFMVARYGDFVRYRPPFKPTTLLLWLFPPIFLSAGIFLFIAHVKTRNQNAETLSKSETEQIEALLKEDRGNNKDYP